MFIPAGGGGSGKSTQVQVGPGGGNAGASRKNEGCFIRFCRIVKPLIRVSCIITNNIACVLKSSCLLQKILYSKCSFFYYYY